MNIDMIINADINPFSSLKLELWWRHPDQFKTSAESFFMLSRKLIAIFTIVSGWDLKKDSINDYATSICSYGIFDWLILRIFWLDIIINGFIWLSSIINTGIFHKLYTNDLISFSMYSCLTGFVDVVLCYVPLIIPLIISKLIFGGIIAAIMLPIIVIVDALSIAISRENKSSNTLDLTGDRYYFQDGNFDSELFNPSYLNNVETIFLPHTHQLLRPFFPTTFPNEQRFYQIINDPQIEWLVGIIHTLRGKGSFDIQTTQRVYSMYIEVLTDNNFNIVNLFPVKELYIKSISKTFLCADIQNDLVHMIEIGEVTNFLRLSCSNEHDNNEEIGKKVANRILPFFNNCDLQVRTDDSDKKNQEAIEEELRSARATGSGLK